MGYRNTFKACGRMNALLLLEYRGSFLLGAFATAINIGTSLGFVWLVFRFVQSLNGWNVYQVLFISALGSLSFAIWDSFFSGTFQLEYNIHSGRFDGILTRPINPLFHLLVKYFDPDSIPSVIIALAVVNYSWSNLGISWSLTNIALLALFAFSGSIIFLSITLIGATFAFWTTRTGHLINMLLQPFSVASYPLEIYNTVIVFVLSFILPFAFVTYYPAQVFLERGSYMAFAYLSPAAALISFLVAYIFWNFGLRHYTSTGS